MYVRTQKYVVLRKYRCRMFGPRTVWQVGVRVDVLNPIDHPPPDRECFVTDLATTAVLSYGGVASHAPAWPWRWRGGLSFADVCPSRREVVAVETSLRSLEWRAALPPLYVHRT